MVLKPAALGIFLLLCATSTLARGLRKTPKVYNALITTDENLTSSRAYPVIQPTIHETGIAHAPLGPFNPYTLFSAPVVRFGQPLVPGLETNEPSPYTPSQLPPQYASYVPPNAADLKTPTGPAERAPAASDSAPPSAAALDELPAAELAPAAKELPKEQLPIALNEYGLPPVLIPLPQQQYAQPQAAQAVNLPPYAYNQYQYPPLLYNQLQREREHYLPPYEYYPNHAYALPQQAPGARQPAQTDAAQSAQPTAPPEALRTLESVAAPPTFEDIKNGASNKNSDVPDVPPPPIPAGPKRASPEQLA